MGLIDRIISRKPRWKHPENKVQDLGFIPEKLNQTFTTRSRSVPDRTFDVNLYEMTCTCPNYTKERHRYPRRDARRVCPHLLSGLRKHDQLRKFTPVLRLILEEGRKYKYFHRLKSTKGDVAVGFNKDSPQIGVFAEIHGETISRTYHLDTRSWTDGPPPDHEPILLETIQRIFQMR